MLEYLVFLDFLVRFVEKNRILQKILLDGEVGNLV
jgi:hypothetical protein